MANTKITASLLDPAQTSITSLGTLSALTISGNLTVDTSTLKVDSSNNRVGVGTASPQAVFHAAATNTTVWPFTSAQSGTYSYTPYPHELVVDNDTTGNEGSFASIFFNAGADSDGTKLAAARIGAVETGNYKADLVFGTRNTSFQERMRILAGGNVGIGTSSPSQLLHVDGHAAITSAYSLMFGDGGERISGNNSSEILNFFTGTTERMRIDSSGVVGIAEGGVRYASRFSVGKPANHTPGSVFTTSPSSFFSEAALGGTTGNSQKIAIFGGSDASNVSGLAIYRYRRATGTNWTTDGFSLRQEVDSSASIYDYINFAGGNVGIGNTNPSGMHANANKLVVGTGSGDQGMSVFAGTSVGRYAFARAVGNNTDAYDGGMAYDGSRNLTFHTNAGSERMRIDGSGNIGIGHTPESYGSGYHAIDIGDYMGIMAGKTGSASYITDNAYWDGSNFKAKNTAAGSLYQQSNGTHRWHTMASVSADANQTVSERMRITNVGTFLIGRTTDAVQNTGFMAIQQGGVYSSINSNVYNTYHYYDTVNSAYKFYVNGSGQVSSTFTSISSISDARLKENVRDYTVGLDDILKLQPRVFDWKEKEGKNIKNDVGFIAQEFEEVFPDWISTFLHDDLEDAKTVAASELIFPMVNAIKELKAEIDALKEKLNG